jgi:hypothetical protein
LAALLVAVQHLDGAVVVDSIASASAGSMTALLAARALARGADPIELMTRAWVELDALSDMVTHDTAAPLSSQSLTVVAEKVLGPNGVSDGPQDLRQDEPVRLSMVLASLSGLSYRLASLERDTPVDASTYVDWYQADITGATSDATYLTYAEAAIASGSNAIGFPPKLLDRTADEATYLAAGILNFPPSHKLWYTDGGTIDNEPLGRAIDLAPPIGDDEQRLFVLLHADPAAATRSGIWQETAEQPSWLRTAMRAVSISRSQSIYDDLKRLEKTNSHLRWKDALAAALEQGLDDGLNQAGLTAAQQSSVRQALASALQAAAAGIEDDRSELHRQQGRQVPTSASSIAQVPPDYQGLLDACLEAATGLGGKLPVRVEVVSPTIDPNEKLAPAAQLAGAFLFHFGGFLDQKFRESDFALGYRNMRYFLSRDFRGYLPPGADLDTALSEVGRRYDELGWDQLRFGGASFKSLSFGEKFELLGLVGHVGHVVEHDFRTWDDQQ